MPEEKRSIEGFNSISFYAYGDVVIKQGDFEEVRIEADEAILERIETVVQDGTLIIRLRTDWLETMGHILMTGLSGIPIHYRLQVVDLKALKVMGAASVEVPALRVDTFKLVLGGAGSIDIDNLQGAEFNVQLKGTGSITTAGNVLDQKVTLAGAGTYDGRHLITERSKVELKGAGSVNVRAEDELKVELKGLGSVVYFGDPHLRKSVSGLGEISHGGM